MRRVALLMLLAFTPLTSCRHDSAVGPGIDATSRPPLAGMSLSPDALVLFHGYDDVVTVRAWDAAGRPAPASTSFTSSDSSVVRASPHGQLHGRNPGRAAVTVRVYLGAVVLESKVEVHVVGLPEDGSGIIVAGARGWSPSALHAEPGSVIRWFAVPNSRGGFSPERITLMDAEYAVVGSLDLATGTATLRVGEAGTVRYCSGACWDPADFGVIEIW